MAPDRAFKGRQFTAEVILWAVRWYLMFPISYRDLELMLRDRGVEQGSRMRNHRLSRSRAAKTGRHHRRSRDHTISNQGALIETG